ncbi:ribosome maturation factor RimM [Chitinophaga nivalis]|uniref:Ribosome maturation factor RimM n=1 Tax=Chitinophaga nivalis TaxID=2991709 RepID=A0ABT3IWY7_9BACT|nr:ribosome maturation factor RimM [Chitinophaga nivalis]MCW3461841.1 ribosome maturation factor RimM [Chitinophaga nivalis]MCW3488465.1 ribosome maturation factor RimM [Chitinophaga nivalis]
MSNYFSIGKLASAHGLQGDLLLRHSLGKRSALKGVTVIFLEERKNSFIPYFVENVTVKDSEHVYIKLEGVDSKEAAHKLMPGQVYLQEEDFKQQTASSAPLAMLGFAVEDKQHGLLGNIEEVIEMPMQVLIKVFIKGKEALLPVNEQSLIKVDKKNQVVYLDLPDGLIELYTA